MLVVFIEMEESSEGIHDDCEREDILQEISLEHVNFENTKRYQLEN